MKDRISRGAFVAAHVAVGGLLHAEHDGDVYAAGASAEGQDPRRQSEQHEWSGQRLGHMENHHSDPVRRRAGGFITAAKTHEVDRSGSHPPEPPGSHNQED